MTSKIKDHKKIWTENDEVTVIEFFYENKILDKPKANQFVFMSILYESLGRKYSGKINQFILIKQSINF